MNLYCSDTLRKGRHGDDEHCLEFYYDLYLLKVETACKNVDKGNLIYKLVNLNKTFLKKFLGFFSFHFFLK